SRRPAGPPPVRRSPSKSTSLHPSIRLYGSSCSIAIFLFFVRYWRPADNVFEKSVSPRSARVPTLKLRRRGRLRYGVQPYRELWGDTARQKNGHREAFISLICCRATH